MSIERLSAHCFRTPDGAEHPTWNTARKHLTKIAFTASIEESGIEHTATEKLADWLFARWRIGGMRPNANAQPRDAEGGTSAGAACCTAAKENT